MRDFEYAQPATASEASRLLAEHDDALALGGGTAAVVLLHLGLLRPSLVVDLSGAAELRGIERRNGGMRVGALTTIRALETSAAIAAAYPVLAEAASQVGSVRVRNAATIGGAVAYGEPQTDAPAALIALGAEVELSGGDSRRTMPLADFFHGPYETDLAHGEIVSAVSLPAPLARTGGCHAKFTIGSMEHKPVANASAVVTLDADGVCREARVVVGAVGPTPLVAERAASALLGAPIGEAGAREAARIAAEDAEPIDDLRGSAWYKRRIVRVLVERAVHRAAERAAA